MNLVHLEFRTYWTCAFLVCLLCRCFSFWRQTLSQMKTGTKQHWICSWPQSSESWTCLAMWVLACLSWKLHILMQNSGICMCIFVHLKLNLKSFFRLKIDLAVSKVKSKRSPFTPWSIFWHVVLVSCCIPVGTW